MKKYLTVFLIAILAVSFAGAAIAADVPSKAEVTKSTQYPAGPIQKAERGFGNVVFGWTEIPKRIVDKTKETNNPIKGLVLGILQGTGKAFARTVSGVGDLITFPIGGYDKPAILPDMPAVEQ